MADWHTTEAPAKLNLALVVGPRRPDGRHEVVTVLERLSLHDTVAVRRAETTVVTGYEDDSLVLDALRGIGRIATGKPCFEARIEKRIPVAAGLGGGSSDAAAALRLGNELLETPLAREELEVLAASLGADQGQLTTIRMGAYLHDVGKVKVPHQVLNKPGRLTDEEFEIIKRHPVWGVELLAAVEFPWNIKPIIRSHHERYDGTGYPDRLKGDEIPLGAQIICIVDVYDALTTTRSYRGAMAHEEALARMEESRHWWRPDVYDGFLRSVGTGPLLA